MSSPRCGSSAGWVSFTERSIGASGYAYRAFISYSRADVAIAAALAENLIRFARPRFAMRAMRVFLD